MEKRYKALVYDKVTKKHEIIEAIFNTKAEFVRVLRGNGYAVDETKVKPSYLFDYIVHHTNQETADWKLRRIPQ